MNRLLLSAGVAVVYGLEANLFSTTFRGEPAGKVIFDDALPEYEFLLFLKQPSLDTIQYPDMFSDPFWNLSCRKPVFKSFSFGDLRDFSPDFNSVGPEIHKYIMPGQSVVVYCESQD